jgi:hypothetical protein
LYTTIERKAALRRAIQSKEEYILPLVTDDAWIEGLPTDTAYLDMREKSLVSICEILIRKIRNGHAALQIKLPSDYEITSIIDNLAERCVHLSGHDTSPEIDTLKSHLEAVMEAFEKVHVSYLETFFDYQDIIESNAARFNTRHPIFRIVEKDIIKTTPNRSKLYRSTSKIKNQLFRSFLLNIEMYMRYRGTDFQSMNTNVIREETLWELKDICSRRGYSDAEKRLEAIELIRSTMESMRYQYERVIKEYQELSEMSPKDFLTQYQEIEESPPPKKQEWNGVIRNCPFCDLPFKTDEDLKLHIKNWHP